MLLFLILFWSGGVTGLVFMYSSESRLLSEFSMKTVFDHSPAAMFILNEKAEIKKANKASILFNSSESFPPHGLQLITFFQCTQHNSKGFSCHENTDCKLCSLKQILASTIEQKTVYNRQEINLRLRNGEQENDFYFLLSTSIITDKPDMNVLVVMDDITARKKAELELEEHRNHMESLVEERTRNLEVTGMELKEKNEELNTTLTNLKNAQEQLIQTEKMASLGLLTAGVAHEINNPLNFIMGGYTALEHQLEEDERITIILKSIKTGIDRVASIVNSLKNFSRNNKSLHEVCNLHEIMDNCLLMLNNQFRYRIEIIKEYSDEFLIMKGNVGKLHQVFMNILVNAGQAIPDKGEIKISILKKDAWIEICIQDSGKGIKKEEISKITEPFYTTKDPGEGTGLGLSITKSIINDHRGTLVFESEPMKGTKVYIRFPESQKI